MPLNYIPCSDIPLHLCNGCIETEQGGVRGAAYIAESYIPWTSAGTIDKTQVETLTWWTDGIEAGNIFVVPRTRGTFDGGSPVTGGGFGDVSEIVTGKSFTLVVNDPDHKENEEFYAAIANAPGAYHVAWITGSELRISEKTVNIDPVDNTEEDVNSQVVWAANITWTQKRKTVQVFDKNPVKEIFSCFEVAEIPS
jgi:hypothetical protein